jgi:hypothetical protein
LQAVEEAIGYAGKDVKKLRPVPVGSDLGAGAGRDGSPWEDNVAELASRIKKLVRKLRADGTISMSKGNLKQMVSSRGLSFPNANAFERGFEEALQQAGVGRFVQGGK